MLSSDHALDYVAQMDNIKGPGCDEFLAAEIRAAKGKKDKHYYWRQELLAAAQFMIERDFAIRTESVKDLSKLIGDEIRDTPKQGWCDPDERAEALRRFNGLLLGKRKAGLKDDIDNLGLFSRMGRSNKELATLIAAGRKGRKQGGN
jgi:hypothetical protein